MNFKIITVPHTTFAAKILIKRLESLGHTAEIVKIIERYDKDIYIIYNASGLQRLPDNYIVQQTEISSSHWFTTSYLRTLSNALAVWDYCEQNQRAYKNRANKLAIVTPGIEKVEHNGKDIELLFYGWIDGSERRERILKTIKDLTIVENIVLDAMWNILKRTKRVINIHYYNTSPLELYRICEAISHGCEVYLWDEEELLTTHHDNLEELKNALKIAGI